MSTETPESIGPYAVVACLDPSADAPVYKVEDSGGRTLAVKLYPPGEVEDLRSFRRDALERVAAVQHPSLVRYEQVGEHEDRVFAAMEFVPGATLRTTLKNGTLPLHKALRIVRQVAGGLGYLHQQGVVHGCLNPSRVLVSTAGDTAKITEPGMCTDNLPGAMAATATMPLARLARYLAPELRRATAAAPDRRSDMYSLGVLFYEALTGRGPEARIRLPSQESDEVPPELDEVVLQCLREDPAARYQTTKELVEAIDRVHGALPGGLGRGFETLTSTAHGMLGAGASRSNSGRWSVLVALGAGAVVVGLLIVRSCA